MNKAEIVRQLAKQTIKQEQDLKIYLKNQVEELKMGMTYISELQITLMKNQDVLHQKLSTISPMDTKVDLIPMMNELTEMKKQNKKLKRQFLISFLAVQVPLLAVLVAYLVVLALTR